MVDAVKLRAWWSHRQGLDGSLAGRSAAEVLEATGWTRSVGGSAPYLTLFSRAGLRRESTDLAVADLDVHELPSARGCTYVVPRRDFALALKAAAFTPDPELKTARKLGVTDDELSRLFDAVRKALIDGPLDLAELRNAVGSAARSFGPEGAKLGVTTSLPIALGALQISGDIRRISVNGRLDQQRYRYALWDPNPLAEFTLTNDEVMVELARAYFRWTGGAKVSEFQWFAGLSVKAAKVATEPLKLEPLVDGYCMLPEDRAAFDAFQPPTEPHYVLVSSLDNLAHLRRDVRSLMADADFTTTFQTSRDSLQGMPHHAILDRGSLVGFWQFDPAAGRIVWMSFAPPEQGLEDAVAVTQEFIREDLDDFRSVSLDSPKSRQPRIEALRAGRAA
ncbi:MAG: hypothetical protein JWN34_1428 [Bryobacterales bacterium]|nr:hypothetical protein [Bryobacterales bacterium]